MTMKRKSGNPNPKISMKKKRNSGNPNPEHCTKKKMNRNWLALPEDVWVTILSKLKRIDVIESAQRVCMLFRKLYKQSSMFIKTRQDCLCDDETLLYIAQRSPNLRYLQLGEDVYVSDEGLIEAVENLPMLEELQLIMCTFSEETVEAVGHALPTLRSFSLIRVGSKNNACVGSNKEALAISTSMPDLSHLQLLGSNMTNEGLKAILDGCPFLESLDLRACFQIDLSGDLGKRCKSIKHLLLPHDSTEDYGPQAYVEQEGFGHDSVPFKRRFSGDVDLKDENSDDDLLDEYSNNEDSDDDLLDEYSNNEDSDDDLEDGDSDDHLEDEYSDEGVEDEYSNDEGADDSLEDGDSDDDLEDEY